MFGCFLTSTEAFAGEDIKTEKWDSVEISLLTCAPHEEVYSLYGSGKQFTLQSPTEHARIFYTLDGSDPTQNSSIYMGPMRLASGTHIKVLAYWQGKQREGIYEFVIGK